MIRRRADSSPDDSGVGLVELLTSMALFSVVVIAVGAVFVNTIETSRYTFTKTATTADTRIAMEAMTRSLRVAIRPAGEASAFVLADTNRVTFYSSLDRGAGQDADWPTRVTYQYDAGSGCLNETQVLSRPTGVATRPFQWTGASSTKCLIRTFTPPSFEYFDDGRIQRTDGTTVSRLTVPAGGFSATRSATTMATIVSVQVSVDVQDPQAVDVNGVQARDRVTLSNVMTALSVGG